MTSQMTNILQDYAENSTPIIKLLDLLTALKLASEQDLKPFLTLEDEMRCCFAAFTRQLGVKSQTYLTRKKKKTRSVKERQL